MPLCVFLHDTKCYNCFVKTSTLIGLLVGLVILAAAIGYTWNVGNIRGGGNSGIACTMEAKLCPDGSSVGRTGPNCEFAACPQAATTTPTGALIVSAGMHCGGFINNAPVCITGYHCQLVVSRPDTGGTCVADGVVSGGNSGIRGTVMLGPTCPVQRMPPDPACADKPYATTIAVYRPGSNSEFAVGKSDTNGTFEFSLPPGSYTLAAGNSMNFPRCASPADVIVPTTGYVTTTISCDTGIR